MSSDRVAVIKSDNLKWIRDLVADHPELQQLGKIVQLRFVIDANIVLAELIWLAKSRRDPTARTNLQEVIASGTVVPFAPMVLEEHVRRRLADISAEENIPLGRLEELWQEYRASLSFHEPDPVATTRPEWTRDPTDVPYLVLQSQVGATAIYTNDKDIKAMGGPVVTAEVILSLRDYARSSAVELSLKIGGVVLTLGAAAAVYGMIRAVIEVFIRLPPAVQLLAVVALVAAILHPRSRTFLADLAHEFGQTLWNAVDHLGPVVLELAAECERAETKARQALEDAQRGLPGPALV